MMGVVVLALDVIEEVDKCVCVCVWFRPICRWLLGGWGAISGSEIESSGFGVEGKVRKHHRLSVRRD